LKFFSGKSKWIMQCRRDIYAKKAGIAKNHCWVLIKPVGWSPWFSGY